MPPLVTSGEVSPPVEILPLSSTLKPILSPVFIVTTSLPGKSI